MLRPAWPRASTCATRAGSCAPWRSRRSGATAPCRRRAATAGPCCAWPWISPIAPGIAPGSRSAPAAQLDGGILPEAEGLRARYPTSLPAFTAIGYREAWDLLDGKIDRAGYLAANVARNVAYARRQRTWFRAAPADLQLDVGDPGAAGRAIERVRSFVREAAGDA